MRYQISICSGCSKNMPLINKKYMMCALCNHKRLNPEKKVKPKKAVKKVRKRTKAQERVEEKLKFVYQEMASIRDHKCTGCGTTMHLSHSHIIPRSKRRDLITAIDNITYHCLLRPDGKSCHDIFEHGTLEERKTLLDFEINMAYIKEIDIAHYYLRGGE